MTAQGAKELADRIAGRLWTQREAFRPVSLSASEAVDVALAEVARTDSDATAERDAQLL